MGHEKVANTEKNAAGNADCVSARGASSYRVAPLPLALASLVLGMTGLVRAQGAPNHSDTGSGAQDLATLPYMNANLPPEQRAMDLVHRMTLQEKASQLVNQARAIPRLGVPAYDWWSEALHGVLAKGTTEFPQPIGLAATFDVPAIQEMATAIGVEGRIKHAQAERDGHSNIFEGLDFWAPNVNIFRDPRWGRGQETYGEDPFLSGRLAVAFVTGLQGTDPTYYRAISTPKHFAVHSGPEPTRHFADVDISRHDQEDTYLPAFRAAVVEGHAGSVMCAYNSINGQPACASEFLLQHTLRGAWQFKGYVVSDCGAIRDVFTGHHYRPTQPEASAIALERGMDNECSDFDRVQDDHDYKPYMDAVQQGYLSERAVDTALVRLFTARMRLGMFDPPARVSYARLDASELDNAAHRALAGRLADESMVLLKNDGVLPLTAVKRIAVLGPLADQTTVLLGNYNGTPTHTVSVSEGMKAEFPGAKITYVGGMQFLSNQGTPVPASVLTTPEGKPGLLAEYRLGQRTDFKSAPLSARVESTVDLNENTLPEQAKGQSEFSVHWRGFLNPPATGDYLLGVKSGGFARVSLGDKPIMLTYSPGANLGRVHLEQGHPLKLEVQYGQKSGNRTEAQLIWAPVNDTPDPAAVEAAKQADVVIAVVGITSRLEGEEMPVDQPGFLGGDRTSLDMPKPEQDLLRAVAATGKPLVVVLLNGSALSVNWEKANANAILEAWYPGEEGGAGIARTLSGKSNPAGRLPVTFYKDTSQLPHFEDYSMKGRTYRYFEGEPLWKFGYGLSYTTFKYSALTLPSAPIKAGDPLNVGVTVTNTGKLAGDEVVQLYLKFPGVPGAPNLALRAFRRVHMTPGSSRKVEFALSPRDLSMVTEAGDIIVAAGTYTVSVGGGQPKTEAPSISGNLTVSGQIVLPE
jgi:beta-glucosidase